MQEIILIVKYSFWEKMKIKRENTKCVFFTGGGIKGTADQMLAHSWFNSYEPELIAIFYDRDKTRVQMFYFLSENYGWLQWNIGNLDKWCKLFSLNWQSKLKQSNLFTNYRLVLSRECMNTCQTISNIGEYLRQMVIIFQLKNSSQVSCRK